MDTVPHSLQGLIGKICDAIDDAAPHILQIGEADFKEEVADRTLKYLVDTRRGTRFVLIVSNPHFPQMVSRAITRLEIARTALNGSSQEPIEMPIAYGIWEGVAYGLWTYRAPLSTNRYYRFALKHLLALKVRPWLRAIALQTQAGNLSSNIVELNFAAPLNALRSISRANQAIRKACDISLKRIENRTWIPVHVLQHGDLWLGNIITKGLPALLTPRSNGFIVIDWAGAKLSGYPFFDLIRFCMSCNSSPRITIREINLMCDIIHCVPEDVVSYLLCALGKLYQEIEQFPEPRFIEICQSSFSFLETAKLRRNLPYS